MLNTITLIVVVLVLLSSLSWFVSGAINLRSASDKLLPGDLTWILFASKALRAAAALIAVLFFIYYANTEFADWLFVTAMACMAAGSLIEVFLWRRIEHLP